MFHPRLLCVIALVPVFVLRLVAAEAASTSASDAVKKDPAATSPGETVIPPTTADPAGADRPSERTATPQTVVPVINVAAPDLSPLVKADAELAARLDLLQQLVLTQRDREVAVYRDTNQLITIFGISFAVIGVAGLVGAAFLNYRGLRAAQLQFRPAGNRIALPGGEETGGEVPGMERIRTSGQRFQARMSTLESRLAEMEHLTGLRGASEARSPAPAATAPSISTVVPSGHDATTEAEARRVVPLGAILVHKAEALLNLGKLDEALATLDQAERTGEVPAEVQLARGRVLERMGRLGDALNAYDLAVVGDERNTSALLMKAGVLNRQERFAEALACYERALELHRANN